MKVSAAACVALAVTASAGTASNRCCADLAAQDSLRAKVFLPGSAVYDAQLETYYSANAAEHAWCVVLPESTADVQAVARTLSGRRCPFGVRAGGHSAWRGSSGVRDGVTVDFGHLNATVFDPATGIAGIQPGARWGSVYETLHPHNVTVVGARTSVVGVGGFVTGSGYSFHSNEHGFSCDNVANWEIVLANGTVVNANVKENADLWKAQKGGSGNLGFVTRIDHVTIPGTQLWGGFTQYDLAKRDDVFEAYLNFVDKTKDGSPDQNIIALFWDSKDGFALRSILTNAHGDANSSAFDEYMSLPNIGSTLTSGPEKDIIPQFTGPTPLGLYANWFTGTAKHSLSALVALDELHRALIPQLQAAAGASANFSTLVSLQPLTPGMAAHGAARGGNVLGLDAVVADGRPRLNWLFSLTAGSAAEQAAMLPVAREAFVRAVAARHRAERTHEPWVFLNYAWRDQRPFRQYGEASRALLRRVSAAYDPRGVFQRLRGTGFKLDGEEAEGAWAGMMREGM